MWSYSSQKIRKIDAYKNAVGDAQSQVANAGALNNPQAAALAAAQNPATAIQWVFKCTESF